MGDAIISRRGAAASIRTITPSINFVSKTFEEIVVAFTNNENTEVELFYGINQNPPTTKITLAANATSSNVTFDELDIDTGYSINAYAAVTNILLKKIKSNIVTSLINTDPQFFINATGGDIEEYELNNKNYRSHTFNENGIFQVLNLGNQSRTSVDFLVVAGGGAGGAGWNLGGQANGGGGGAGGYRTSVGTTGGGAATETPVPVSITTYNVTVGAGGIGADNFPSGNGANGNASTFSNRNTIGGGGGGSAGSFPGSGASGGSGGSHGGHNTSSRSVTGGNGTTGQGFRGHPNVSIGSFRYGIGGGAGAEGESSQGNGATKVNGLNNILRIGTDEFRANGGRAGGSGRVDGPANTGNGGSGGTSNNTPENRGGNGGSGIVVIRYEIAPTV